MKESILPILQEASKAILDIYADEASFNTELKGDSSPLTEADKRANQIICEALADLFPGIPVISEETKQALYAERAHYTNFFLVDPLDGTREFIKRNGEFTINIAYLEGHHPVGGYVFVPCTGMAYVAEYGGGAYRIDRDGVKTELRAQPFRLNDSGLNVVASRSHRDSMTDKIISGLREPVIVSTGSSLKFLLIAEGKANFYPRLAPTMEWDTAAAQCILEEAGGSLLQFDNLQPLVYNKPDLLNPHFIAMGALLDPESLVDLLRTP
ncbi:MAG TPA: 3'(2'),5'-bisphosphate nucleotidase CysQ [Saprospiraceae bacterium]|nr:3'(2'),5'-bisphosphate nucleotidase CysQ [Saprospiraceae bacterium]